MLAEAGEVELVPNLEEATVARLAVEADALLTRGRGRITGEVLAAGKRLRAVARCGVGLDNIDLPAASERGVPVLYAPGSTTGTLAEHTLLLLLAAARRLCSLDAAARGGRWEVREGYQGRELAGKLLGVVGLGDIGRRVAELAVAFGMRVVYWSPISRDARFHLAALDELLAAADMVTLHVQLREETHQMIGARQLALMRPGAILVNTARGALVDEWALAQALQSGHLAAYAADVLAEEPPRPDHPLLGAPNLLLTPHSAALTDRSYEAMCVETAASVLRILRGEPPELRCVANLAAVRERYGW
jgi:phosphoglycerate dehydrogenase-like enzyme